MDTYYILKTYTDQLINVFEKPIYKIMIELFEESIITDEENKLKLFQSKILDIKNWNNDRILEKYNKIDKNNISENLLNGLIEKIFKIQNEFLSKNKSA